jgi:serine phosphatase RsbU (regulator of sigma subunit)
MSRWTKGARRIGGFWREVSEGLTLQELWLHFRRETGASVRLYTRELGDEARARPRMTLMGRLFWAMLLKLSPPRRIVLLAALIVTLVGLDAQHHGWALIGSLALLLLLGLELADRVALRRDLEIARDIQRWLVPQTPPAEPGVDIAFRTRPANTVAGDYYDAFPCAECGPEGARRLVLVMADVAGKGMPAALLMAAFQSSLHTLAQERLALVERVARLNRYSFEHSLEGRRFTTAFLAELDTAEGVLTFVNAGHNPPTLRRASCALEWLEAGGLPLGIQREAGYQTGAVALAPGDQLVIYTDGVVEARDARDQEFGQPRLAALLGGLATVRAADTLERVMEAVDRFVGDAGRSDDTTCMVMRFTGNGGPS